MRCGLIGVSPLAAQLFEIDGIVGVFLAASFLTVTKRQEVEWTDIAQSIVDAVTSSLDEWTAHASPADDVTLVVARRTF